MNNPWLDIEKPNTDYNVILVGDSHPLRLFWGRDTQGHYLFIFDTNVGNVPEKKNLPKLTGIKVMIATSGCIAKLVLILNDTSNWELFRALCSDLVRVTSGTEDSNSAGIIFQRRLTRWQEFLKRERSGILSTEAIKGLIGELLFLADKVAPSFGWDSAVTFWKGPEEAPQDFAIHNTAIEIKCQSGSSKPTVRITSEEQLEPQLSEGFLVVYTIATSDEDDPMGFTLNGVVERIRNELEASSENARERFEDLLFLTGYIGSEEYEEYRFIKIAVRSFQIEDDFPRIRASDISSGIEHITYTLKLEACAPFEGKPNWWKD